VGSSATLRFSLFTGADVNGIMCRIGTLLRDVASEFPKEMCLVSPDCTELHLQHLRSTALAGLQAWESKLQEAAEARQKSEKAVLHMTEMREAYFKELNQLREQLYQKQRADEKGEAYNPLDVVHFDPKIHNR